MDHFFPNIQGWSSEHQGQFPLIRRILVDLSADHLVVAELGVWLGRQTAMWVVELLNANRTFEYHAVDWFNETNTCEAVMSNLRSILDKVTLVKSSTLAASKLYPDGYFDIVSVDAGHDYPSVKSDLHAWYPKVKKGGWICGDDYAPDWPGVIKAVNEFFDKSTLCFDGTHQWSCKKVGKM